MFTQYPSLRRRRRAELLINKMFIAAMFGVLLVFLCSCSNSTYAVNKRINRYNYIPSASRHLKTPEEFYADGGGNCKDFANAKKAILGGEIVLLPELYVESGELRSHAVLKVDGFLLDSRFNELRLASSVKTIPYGG